MGTIATKDGTTIFYKDWGPQSAQPIMFHHGWPLSGDDWDTQMIYFLDQGIVSSPMTAVATDDRARSVMVTTWTTTPRTSPPWSHISISGMLYISAIRPGAARPRIMPRGMAKAASPSSCSSARSPRSW